MPAATENDPRESSGREEAGESQNSPPHRRAFRSPLAVAAFLALTAAGLAADLVSKHAVFASFLDRPDLPERVAQIREVFAAEFNRPAVAREVLHCFQRPVCPGVHFTLSVNPGVVFGLPMPRPAVAAATVLTVVLVLFFFASSDAGAWWVHAALAFVLAGAAGNLYDRLFSRVALPDLEPILYHVRDFIDCSDLYYPWIFNVADILLVAGVAMLVVHWLFDGRRQRKDGTPRRT